MSGKTITFQQAQNIALQVQQEKYDFLIQFLDNDPLTVSPDDVSYASAFCDIDPGLILDLMILRSQKPANERRRYRKSKKRKAFNICPTCGGKNGCDDDCPEYFLNLNDSQK